MEIQAHVHPDHTQMAKYAYNAHKVNTVRIRSYQAESVAMMGIMHSILEWQNACLVQLVILVQRQDIQLVQMASTHLKATQTAQHAQMDTFVAGKKAIQFAQMELTQATINV